MNSDGVALLLYAVATVSTLVGCGLAEQACPSENVNRIHWKYDGTNTFVTSDPWCLAKNGLLVTRNCSNGDWIPGDPQCEHDQKPTPAVACPSEWKQISSQSSGTLLCAKFETTTAWENTCLNYDGTQNTIFDLTVSDWRELFERYQPTYSSVWLPGKWTSEDTIRWMLPGKMMRSQAVDRTRIRQNHRAGSGCVLLSLENERYYLSNVDCSEAHSMLCLSTEPSKLLQLSCPQGYLTNQRNANESWCHTVMPLDSTEYNAPPGHNLFEMWNANVLNVPKQLLRNRTDQCAFNPTPNNLTTFYRRSDFDSNYTYAGFVNWRPTTDYSVADDYLVFDSNGQWSFSAQLTCAIWSQKIELKLPALQLNFTSNYQQLRLTVTDQPFVWQESPDGAAVSCYRSDGSTEVRIDVERVSGRQNEAISYRVQNLRPGVHTCEAYATKSMTLVRSPQVMVDAFDEFVCTVVVKLSHHSFEQFLKNVQEHQKLVMTHVKILRFQLLKDSNSKNVTFRATVRHIGVLVENDAQRIRSKIQLIAQTLGKVSSDKTRPPNVTSTQLCFNFSSSAGGMALDWPALRVGHVVKAVVNCSDASQHPVLGACILKGEFRIATWDIDDRTKCQTSVPKLTVYLQKVVDDFHRNSSTFSNAIDRVWKMLRASDEILDSLQLFLINQIMYQTRKHNNLDATTLEKSLNIFDKLMEKPPQKDFQFVTIIKGLLQSFQSVIIRSSDKPSIDRKHFRVVTLDPRTNNYSGIAVLRSGAVEFLHSNHSIDAIFDQSDLLVATYIPDTILSRMQRLTKIVYTIIKNDNLYQQPLFAEPLQLASYIINIQIPNVNTTALPGPIPVFFSNVPEDGSDANGRYWETTNNDGWMNTNLVVVRDQRSITQLNATYLACFAMLITEGTTLGRVHQRYIAWISVIGCCLSLVGIALIFLTAFRFPRWSEKASTVILLELSFAIGTMLMLFLTNVFGVSSIGPGACQSIGALLHYIVLVVFLWMLVMCYLQFVRYIVVFPTIHTSAFFLKVSIACWTLPAIPVVAISLVSPDSYVVRINAGQHFCYAAGAALWYGVIGPVAVIAGGNLIIYAWIVVGLVRIKQRTRVLIRNQIRVSVLLFFLLGLPWLFGLLIHWGITRTVCYYLFSMFGTLQGVVLFVNCVVLDKDVRVKWAKVIGWTEYAHARMVTDLNDELVMEN